MGKVIEIKATSKRTLDDLLTDHQIGYIQKVLERSCVGAVCISRLRLFEELREPLKLTIEQYQFEQALTRAIKAKRIAGFETRSGRNGGICRAGAFTKKDSARKKQATKRNKRCTITINKNTYVLSIKESRVKTIFESVLGATPAKTKGNVFINNTLFDVPSGMIDVCEKFLQEIAK